MVIVGAGEGQKFRIENVEFGIGDYRFQVVEDVGFGKVRFFEKFSGKKVKILPKLSILLNLPKSPKSPNQCLGV